MLVIEYVGKFTFTDYFPMSVLVDGSSSRLFSLTDKKMTEFMLQGKLGDITNEASVSTSK